MATTFSERFSRVLDTIESRWSLYAHAVTLMAAFGLPAWATRAANIFSQYAPLSWVVAGFIGVIAWAVARLIWYWASQIKIRVRYDAQFLQHGGNFNPLDNMFERRRIFLNDFVLPSHPIIEGKTFIDCDIVGPANLYFVSGNQINPIRMPVMDAVCLDVSKQFWNGFVAKDCFFRNCSFQRVTVFASQETYEGWKNNPMLNWITPAPPPMLSLTKSAEIGAQPPTEEASGT